MDPLVTKTISAAAGPLRKESWGLINRLLGPAADEYGAMLRDGIIARRQRNLDRIAAKAAARVGNREPSPPTISTRTAVALIDQASLEDEGAGLEEQWAGLLASAAAGVSVPSAYPAILSQMSPIDAQLLIVVAKGEGSKISVAELGRRSNIGNDTLMEGVDNLLRLRLCTLAVPRPGDATKISTIWPELSSSLQLTILGKAFLNACSGPGADAV